MSCQRASPRLSLKTISARVAAAFALALGATVLFPGTALPQSPEGPPVVVDPTAATAPDIAPPTEPGDGTSRKTGRGVTPMFIPIPMKNTQLGWGLMLMGGLIHRFDPDTTIKPSTAMAGAFATENGSWGLMAIEDARLSHDRWRLRAMLAHMEIRYDYFGIGEDAGNAGKSVAVQQNMNLAMLMILRRVAKNFYLGPTVLYMGAAVSLRDTSGLGLPPPAADTAHMQLFAPGLQAEFDTRNSDYWPVHGTKATLKGWFFLDADGGSPDFQRALFFWSYYTPVRGKGLVLAANLNACGASGDAPFWSLCSIGAGQGGLRGYTQGRYRDAVMTTEQVELRFHTAGRFGGTVFGGLGHVAPTFGDIFEAEVQPAGGLGLRYQLTKNYPMHARLDYAWGRDGGLLYFAVAEAF
ncbi:MAG TPA: hypothetical protein VGN76_04725 [Gemmatimonadales bacterium]|jgi:hypothetical protein|nr:hypothetical protein [Gemmatimonadales bacterium]